MASVYVYDWDNSDYSTIGECGALDATNCTFEEIGGGMSEIALIHPIDALEKFTFLKTGAILKANVPVRTTPEIENGQFVTRVERWTVKQTTTKQQRYVFTKKSGGRRSKTLQAGTEVIVTQKPEGVDRWKIKSGKISGWISNEALESKVEITLPETVNGMEDAIPSWESREQLFRIYKVNKSDDGITCNARHIQYDLLQNLTNFNKDEEVTLQQSGDGILDNCLDAHDFRFYTDISGTQPSVHYTDTDPVTAFLDPDSGLLAAWDAQLVRDNYDIYMLGNAGIDRGVRIEYAKNMLGVEFDESTESTATAIRPIGEKKNGEPLYLPDNNGLVMSKRAEEYPFVRIYPLKCKDCTEGTNNVTLEIALLRMREQAEALIEEGADLPEISVKVTFANLGRDERYKQYRNLENMYLYDTVTVRNPRLGIDEKTQVIRIMWDCLNEKMLTVELGSLQALSPSVASWQISGGISGSKLVSGSVGAAQIKGNSISLRHLQAGSVNADAIQANSITADKIASGAITAGKIQTNALDAIIIEAVKADIKDLNADNINTSELYAALANITVLAAGTATFDQATVKHLISSAMNLEFGEADRVYITNLAVMYAQLMHATIADLCIKASDGNYYTLDVNQNGHVTAVKSTITDGEISTGQTFGGKIILETSMTVENLNTSNLLGTYALINRIDAAKIDVGELFAREAFIALLRTSRIIGDKSITLIAEQSEQASRSFRQNGEPTGAKAGDIWIEPDTGSTYQAESAEDAKLRFAIDREGKLYFSAEDENVQFETDDFDLFCSGVRISENPDGTLTAPFRWALVQDESMLADIKSNKDYLDRVIRIDPNGLHVGDSESFNEVLVDSDGVNVVVGGQEYSKFAGRYVQFGNYKIGLADDEGLMFKPL